MSSRKFVKVSIAVLTKIIIFLGFLFIITVSSNAQEKGDPKWFTCTEDSQCLLVRGACGGPESVNEDFVDDADHYFKRMAMTVNCVGGYSDLKNFMAICVENKCTVKEAEKVKK